MICSRCIMDHSDPAIEFDENGICNHCHRYDELVSGRTVSSENQSHELKKLIKKIKASGRKKEYDCLIGVSGGVDSSYLAYLSKECGLRPLAVHVDNGWNSELATNNIHNLLKKLNMDLHTHVIDWNEFKNLQLSFLHAGVPDGEIPSDHAIDAALWICAHKFKIKYILSGMNFATESISVPDWAYGHSDWKYIKSVHKIFKNTPLTTFPRFSFIYLFYVNFIKRIRIISFLNYFSYNKENAIHLLEKELDWRRYEGKHYESIYTRFYQGYILPKKFGIDKRRMHLSDLINAGQITRDQALNEIEKPTMSEEILKQDYDFVLKKFDLNELQFQDFMNAPNKSFRDYPNSFGFVQFLRNLVNLLRKYSLYPK